LYDHEIGYSYFSSLLSCIRQRGHDRGSTGAATFWNGSYPFIDYSTGGSIDGMIRATETNLAKVTDSMIVIPGHGAVGDKSQLAFYRDLLVSTREKVAALKRQGKSLDEIVAAKPTTATDAKWGNGFRSPKDFIGDVFQGV
jgi:hypothetical protein